MALAVGFTVAVGSMEAEDLVEADSTEAEGTARMGIV